MYLMNKRRYPSALCGETIIAAAVVLIEIYEVKGPLADEIFDKPGLLPPVVVIPLVGNVGQLDVMDAHVPNPMAPSLVLAQRNSAPNLGVEDCDFVPVGGQVVYETRCRGSDAAILDRAEDFR
jgi:hypothetical protein